MHIRAIGRVAESDLKGESTMTKARRVVIGVLGLAGTLFLAGCQNPYKQQAEVLSDRVGELQSENDKLRADNDSLRTRLAQAVSERDAAQSRVWELQRENDELRRQATRPPERTVPEGWTPAGEYAWIDLGSDLLFRSGQAALNEQGKATVRQVFGQIQETFPDKMIWVVGHTDAEPIRVTKDKYKDNLALSLARGATVFRELHELGMEPQRMIAGGQGEYNPKAPNDARGRGSVNRRVQIWAVPMPAQVRETPASSGLD
jgi:flagellar motor protein MotB